MADSKISNLTQKTGKSIITDRFVIAEDDGGGGWDSKYVNLEQIVEGILTHIIIPIGDETTPLSTTAGVFEFRMPHAFTLTSVRASITTAGTTSGLTTIDINGGSGTLLSTKITIDLGELTSTTAATPPVISDNSLTDDERVIIDIDTISGGGTEAGLKVYLIGYKLI